MSILPHGGRLVNRTLAGEELEAALEKARSLEKIRIEPWEVWDLFLIATGGYSPLEGFVDRKNYLSVMDRMELEDGTLYAIPIVLSASDETASKLAAQGEAAIVDGSDNILATIEIVDIFDREKEREARAVFRTTDEKHPGVARIYKGGDKCVAGPIRFIGEGFQVPFSGYPATPEATRNEIERKGWDTCVAFQTRNPVHRAHEYLQKCAMEMVDGLLLHPIVGEIKEGDIPAEVRMRCYEVLIENYYPKDRVILGVLPAPMRYAGPREAIHHAIMRQNYGCTHIIIGRDHAGVGNYYGTFDAQRIFDEIDRSKLLIQPLFFDHAFFCKRCGQMATVKTCPHGAEHRIFLSGTKVREKLRNGEDLPPEFTRREVAEILKEYYRGLQNG
ncbi:MAG TPA: sulfate adenylyltransferase [Proteobacteria bacterium]|nr:sulfate adenylyltransferase [Pseudomonadota bacterium]